MTKHKSTLRAQVKAHGDTDDLEEGQFWAYAAVFDSLDSDGDVIVKGAFADTLKAWEGSDAPIPALWGHDFSDMHNNIGHVVEAKEDDHGLLVKVQLDLEHPNGKQAHRLIDQKRVTDLSFAFDVLEHKIVRDDDTDDMHVELLKMNLHEVSVVPIGANRETGFLGVKAAARKLASAAGRIQSAKSESETDQAIKSLADHLIDLGHSLRGTEDTEEIHAQGTDKPVRTYPVSDDEDTSTNQGAGDEATEPHDDHETPDDTDERDAETSDGKAQADSEKSAAEWRSKKMHILKLKGVSL